jgi:hypothetical protein
VISYEELLHHSLGKIMKTHLSKTGVKAEIWTMYLLNIS